MFNTHKLVIRYIFQNDNMINLYLSPHMITFNNESKSQKMNCKFPQQAGLSVGLEEKLPIPFQLDKGGHNEAEDIPISWAYQSTNWEFLMKQFFFFFKSKTDQVGPEKGIWDHGGPGIFLHPRASWSLEWENTSSHGEDNVELTNNHYQ